LCTPTDAMKSARTVLVPISGLGGAAAPARSTADVHDRAQGWPGPGSLAGAPGSARGYALSELVVVVAVIGIMASAGGFGVVFGLAARQAGFSVIEASVMSVVVFAGAAQFAAVGFVRAGMPWPAIFLLTALLNARHLLYSAALRPWLVKVPALKRAVMAHFLTDEGFALSVAHFQRLGFADLRGYWLAAIGATFIPWNVATLIGVIGAMFVRYWFAARRLGFAIGRDGTVLPLPGPSFERFKRVARGPSGP